jgi:carbon monoxide dehydrogenase subunit G
MQMTGEQHIAAPPATVWKALNDPDVLRQSIPGCQTLDKEDDEHFRATVEVKIGPIGARFNGRVALSDIDPPNGYTINGEGQGGTVGHAKGGAKVRLKPDNGGTLLTYQVDAQVGGRLAQLGGPIIDATAKRLAAQFFSRFGEIVAGGGAMVPAAAGAGQKAVAAPAGGSVRTGSSVPAVLAAAAALVIGFLAGHSHDEWIHIALLALVLALVSFEVGRRVGGARR